MTSGVSGVSPLHDVKITAGPWATAELMFSSDMDGQRHELVEPDGIEPTTSCLQSTRSPN